MSSTGMMLLLLSIISVLMLVHASGTTDTEISSFLEHDNGQLNTIAYILQQMASSIRNQEVYQNQTTITVSQLERDHIQTKLILSQLANTQIQMANAHAEMSNVLNQVVRMLHDMNEGFSRTCQNQGQCVNNDNGYTCECQVRWTGVNREKDVEECASAPCQNGGLCIEGVNNYTCQCVDGWTGILCEINIDDCASAPCLNGGQCIDGVNQYMCQCFTGWTGATCEINVDECESIPCKNGGQCIDGVNNYTCQCLAGWTGIICETSPTCQPDDFLCGDGSCIYNKWVCDRVSDCEDGTDEEQTLCATCPYKFLCTNGRCVDLEDICDGTDTCRDNSDEDQICVDIANPSVTGFNTTSVTLQWNEPRPELTGTLRREITQYAVTFTSQDSGELHVMFVPAEDDAVYTETRLAPGTTYEIKVDVVIDTEGQGEQTYDIGIPTLTASTQIDECSSAPCHNGGQCIDGVNQYMCHCTEGRTGDFCEINVDECASNPCINGGQCIDGVNNYTCQCVAGWTGILCETNIDECSSIPCQNGGQCIDGVNQFTCQCVRGYTGYFCENNPTCQPGNFLCDDGRCIPSDWVCDKYPDCVNGTDEEETTCAFCPFKFLCTNGRCVDLEDVCDGTNQCQDNSDEDQICVDMATPSVAWLGRTSITLQLNESTPKLTGTPQRIITQYVVTTTPREGGESRVDYIHVKGELYYMKCYIEGLQPDTAYAIGVDVIINTEGQGEQSYDMGIPLVTATTLIEDPPCEADLFTCYDGSCIPSNWVCDGFPDCEHGTDEVETMCATCPYKFLCSNGRCVELEDICDGTNNCEDNSDEDRICVDISTSIASVYGTIITLQWNTLKKLKGNPQRNITQYAVRITRQDGGESQSVFVSAVDDTVFNATGLQPVTAYVIDIDVVIDTEGQGEQTYDIGIPEVTVTTTSCSDYLGIENGDIPDGNIQASTYHSSTYHPRKARLNGVGGWYVASSSSNPWIQGDIGYQTYVSGVATQGYSHGSHWVTSFKVSTFSMTTSNPETCIQDSGGSIKVYQGNTDYNSIVTSTFPEPVFVRIVRITCLKKSYHWGMRFEILGCKQDDLLKA